MHLDHIAQTIAAITGLAWTSHKIALEWYRELHNSERSEQEE